MLRSYLSDVPNGGRCSRCVPIRHRHAVAARGLPVPALRSCHDLRAGSGRVPALPSRTVHLPWLTHGATTHDADRSPLRARLTSGRATTLHCLTARTHLHVRAGLTSGKATSLLWSTAPAYVGARPGVTSGRATSLVA